MYAISYLLSTHQHHHDYVEWPIQQQKSNKTFFGHIEHISINTGDKNITLQALGLGIKHISIPTINKN